MSKKKNPVVPEAQQALAQLRKEIVDSLSIAPKSLREEFKDRARQLVDETEKDPALNP